MVWKVQLQQVKYFYIPCNELIHKALLNQKCFSPQSLSCSYHRLTSMQMGLVVICSSSISYNFSLEGPILTSQAFFYVACNELIHIVLLNQNCFSLKVCRVRIVDLHPLIVFCLTSVKS